MFLKKILSNVLDLFLYPFRDSRSFLQKESFAKIFIFVVLGVFYSLVGAIVFAWLLLLLIKGPSSTFADVNFLYFLIPLPFSLRFGLVLVLTNFNY